MDAGSADGPGPRPDDDAAQPVAVLEELLAARGEHLLRTAVLLAGSRADGEDLLQAALELIAPIPKGFREVYQSALKGVGQRLRVTTHSTWWVIGNASNARSPSTRQPPAISRPRSRARVAGSQET